MSELEALLKSLAKEQSPKQRYAAFMAEQEEAVKDFPVEKQVETLVAFNKVPDLKVGDIVVANELGKSRMKYPNIHRHGIITEVFSEPMIDEDGRVIHGSFACAFSENEVITYTQDFRYLKKVEAA